ncbi:CGNR zinc finger domain-containing protein [Marinomonas sp. 5E14-1]|uniref:CGNR zinc finger domain-containing protein n=1 Tax=Marinomonas sp. 5E14-1 TaxID=3153922 RepID=UPI0032654342
MNNHKPSFIYLGNSLAMDFINTQFASHEEIVERLTCFGDIHQWAAQTGIELDACQCDSEIEAVWELRGAIKTLMGNKVNQQTFSQEAVKVVNSYLCHAPNQQQLLVVNDGMTLQPLCKKLTLNQLLGKISHEAAELLTSSKSEQIKACSNERCILMFLDTSRSKKRRWCSMERCGNRAKAANFYHAHKANG